MPIEKIQKIKSLLDWFEDILIPNMLPVKDYNNNDLTTLEKQFISTYNKRLGTARLRVVRVEEDSCTVPAQLEGKIKECYATSKRDLEHHTPRVTIFRDFNIRK